MMLPREDYLFDASFGLLVGVYLFLFFGVDGSSTRGGFLVVAPPFIGDNNNITKNPLVGRNAVMSAAAEKTFVGINNRVQIDPKHVRMFNNHFQLMNPKNF